MSNVVIDYDSLLNLLRREFELLVRNTEEFSDLIFDIEDEQSMAKLSERDKNKIYVLVKFGAANPYGQAALPLSLERRGVCPSLPTNFLTNWNCERGTKE